MLSASPRTNGRPHSDRPTPRVATAASASRLRGSIWEHSAAAHLFYRSNLSLGRGLARLGVTANSLTYASLVIAGAAGIAAGMGYFLAAAGFVLASGVCDVLDGIVARTTDRVTPYGALLDSTVDRLADAMPFVGLVVFYQSEGWIAAVPAAAMAAGFVVSYVRARAEGLGATLPPLFMRRAERVVLLAASLALGVVPAPVPIVAPLLLVGIAIIGLWSMVGAVAALRAARRVLGEADAPSYRPSAIVARSAESSTH